MVLPEKDTEESIVEKDEIEQEVLLAETQAALEKEREALKKAEENMDAMLRQVADYQNSLKRAKNDVEQARKFAIERFAGDLLAVLDSMERGLIATPKNLPKEYIPLKEGLEITAKQLTQVLSKFSVNVFDPQGQAFDPEWHAALSVQPTEEYPPNQVLEVIQKGYTLQGRLLRAAQVIISRAPDPDS
jgi:molecular chaperone GrpE